MACGFDFKIYFSARATERELFCGYRDNDLFEELLIVFSDNDREVIELMLMLFYERFLRPARADENIAKHSLIFFPAVRIE